MEVEIWSDVACPWCYVGKRRFEAALAAFADADAVRVTWRSFELDPGAPAERGGRQAEHLAAKYGMTVDEAQAKQAQMTAMAAQDGLDFRFDLVRGGNMLDVHRLVHLAEAHGMQDAMKERAMRAYLTEGQLMSDPAVLTRLAADVGLPAGEVRELLATERLTEEVRDDERTAAALGISAVPCFVVDRRIAASGAQSPEVLLDLLQRGWAQRAPA